MKKKKIEKSGKVELYHVFLIEVTVRGAIPQGNHQIIPRIK
jgi:hypothetical protein